MKHDGDGNGCLTDSHSYIMAAKLGEPNGLHSKWSDCSREYLTAFLEWVFESTLYVAIFVLTCLILSEAKVHHA